MAGRVHRESAQRRREALLRAAAEVMAAFERATVAAAQPSTVGGRRCNAARPELATEAID